MSQDNQTKPPFKPHRPLFHYITMGAALLGVFLLWRQQENAQKQMKALIVQNNGLQQELKKARAKIDDFNSGDSSAAAKERTDSIRTAIQSRVAPEEKETLVLQPPTVEQTASGLSVRFSFKPIEGAELPARLTLVVRVPGDTATKILSLKPVAKPSYSNVECIVNANGKLGMIAGDPSDLQALSFELVVSAPVKALVRGSEGIKDFDIDIGTDSCTIQQL